MSQPAASLAAKVIARARKAGLPPELVPDELESVLVAEAEAETRLRAATHAFITRIRVAENAARAQGKAALGAADWAGHWPS